MFDFAKSFLSSLQLTLSTIINRAEEAIREDSDAQTHQTIAGSYLGAGTGFSQSGSIHPAFLRPLRPRLHPEEYYLDLNREKEEILRGRETRGGFSQSDAERLAFIIWKLLDEPGPPPTVGSNMEIYFGSVPWREFWYRLMIKDYRERLALGWLDGVQPYPELREALAHEDRIGRWQKTDFVMDLPRHLNESRSSRPIGLQLVDTGAPLPKRQPPMLPSNPTPSLNVLECESPSVPRSAPILESQVAKSIMEVIAPVSIVPQERSADIDIVSPQVPQLPNLILVPSSVELQKDLAESKLKSSKSEVKVEAAPQWNFSFSLPNDREGPSAAVRQAVMSQSIMPSSFTFNV